MDTETLRLDPSALRAAHRPTNDAHLDALVASMSREGWTGRPVLAFAGGEGDAVRALTASHRLAAAVAAGLDAVPVLVLTVDSEGLYGDLEDALRGSLDLASLTTILSDHDAPADAIALSEAEDAAHEVGL